MKGILRIVLFCITTVLSLLLGVYVVLLTRQSDSGQQLVHPDSDAIVRVNIDMIVGELLQNAIRNPSSYWEASKDSVARPQIWKAGFDIPANLYFFALPDDTLSAYALIKLKSKVKFQAFLQEAAGALIDHTNNFEWIASTQNDRLTVVGNEQYAVISFGKKPKLRIVRSQEFLSSMDDLVPIKALNFPAIKESKSALTYWSGREGDVCHVDFSSGKLSLHGHVSSSLWNLPELVTARDVPADNILTLWVDADIRGLLPRYRDLLSQYNIPVDSIQPYIGDYLELQMRDNNILQQDTIVSYDYDDNFELVEKREVRSESVPDLSISLKASPHLLSYLPEKAFYRFYKQVNDGVITLSTDQESKGYIRSRPSKQQNGYNFRLKYQRENTENLFQSYFFNKMSISGIDLKGTRKDRHMLSVSGEITFENPSLHPLKQVL